jgi:quercetin dioxygenase-like cupin family protein
MFYHHNDEGFRAVLPGIRLKTLVHGEKTSFTEFHMDGGSQLPDHAHPHEQTGYMVSGRMRLTIGDETLLVEPGDSWNVPGNIRHRAEILEDCVVIEVFSPVREDYLPRNLK